MFAPCKIFLSPIQADDSAKEAAGTASKKREDRFDLTVREDYFAGFQGDKVALDRGMKASEAALATNPKHAEAMVWLGGGEVFLSGEYFSKGNFIEGGKMWQKGIEHMDKAAELEPSNIGVLIPRAAVLMPASRNLPGPIRDKVLEGVLKNFVTVYAMQKDELDKIGEHPLGELRMGLADIYRSLGKLDESKVQLEAVSKELPNTEYATEAKKWLDAKPSARLAHNCIGCHSK